MTIRKQTNADIAEENTYAQGFENGYEAGWEKCLEHYFKQSTIELLKAKEVLMEEQ